MAAVTDAHFEAQVLKSDKPVLVDFWAEWCGPCRQVAPILDEINAAHGDKITFVKMNVDENPVTPSSYKVTGIPTINVYQGGEVVKCIVGAKPQGRAPQGARRLPLRGLDTPARPSRALDHRGRQPHGRAHARAGSPSSAPARSRTHSRSTASSTSLFQVRVVRRSIRIRGVVTCARWVLKPTAPEEVRGHHAARSPVPRVSPKASTAAILRSPGRGPSPAPGSGPVRRPGARVDVHRGQAAPRRARRVPSGWPWRRRRTAPARRSRGRDVAVEQATRPARAPLAQHPRTPRPPAPSAPRRRSSRARRPGRARQNRQARTCSSHSRQMVEREARELSRAMVTSRYGHARAWAA